MTGVDRGKEMTGVDRGQTTKQNVVEIQQG
jgi:hypothetical protein